MRKRLLALCTMALLVFFMFSATAFAEANNTKKVIIHYHRLDGVYDEVGVWTWGNGTNGSADGIAKTGVDAFGAVIEITVGADAEAKGNFIPLKKEMPQNSKTFPKSDAEAKDSFEKKDISYDRSALLDGTVNELHLYFIEGNDTVFTNKEERSMYNKEGFGALTIIYYDPASQTDSKAYDNWDFWTWNTGKDGTGAFDEAKAAGVPFQWEYKLESKVMKVGVVNVAADAQDTVGFIPKKGAWEAKGTFNDADMMLDVKDIKGSGHKVVFYTRGSETVGLPSNKPEFVPYNVVEGTGIFADSLTAIFVEFTVPVDAAVNSFAISDAAGNAVTISSVEASDATKVKYIIKLDEANKLDKAKEYNLTYGDQAKLTTALELDKNAPVINYTKKKDYVLNKGDDFDISKFIRLSAIDDRAGNLTDKMTVEGKVNNKKAGTYTVTYSAVDNWGNVGSESFTFTVLRKGPHIAVVYIIVGVAVVAAAGIAYVFLRKKKK